MTDNGMPEDRQRDQLVEMILELGYRAKLSGETAISTSMSGFSVVVFHTPGHSIQMYSGFTKSEGSKFELEVANKFNGSYKFVKSYIVDNIARFEGDFLFRIEEDDAIEDLKRIFQSWEISLGFVAKALAETA